MGGREIIYGTIIIFLTIYLLFGILAMRGRGYLNPKTPFTYTADQGVVVQPAMFKFNLDNQYVCDVCLYNIIE